MSSGDDIEAGTVTTAESTTILNGALPSEKDVNFNGKFIFQVGPQPGLLAPRNSIHGILGVGNLEGTGVIGASDGIGVEGISNQVQGVSGTGAPGVFGKVGINVQRGPNSGVIGVIEGQKGAGVFGGHRKFENDRPLDPNSFDVDVSKGTGVFGISTDNGHGVVGISGSVRDQKKGPDPFLGGTGVFGFSQGGPGVAGRSRGTGVRGDGGTAVLGMSPGDSGARGRLVGVMGLIRHGLLRPVDEPDGSPLETGVRGIGQIGVEGLTTGEIRAGRAGVKGTCDGLGVGVHGIGNGLAAVGVRAESAEGGIALFAENKGNSIAGFFRGNVLVNGNFIVVGSTKSAAVPHPDGSHRLLYCMESPESWFEDFGEGKLVDGKAEVRLDPDFTAVIKSNKYHVFVTPYGNSNGLYVTHRNSKGFRVQEQNGGKSNLTFSYRVVAKRKDIKAERLAGVTLPEHPVSKVAKQPHKPAGKKRSTSDSNSYHKSSA